MEVVVCIRIMVHIQSSAAIAKIVRHCVPAMSSGMFRLHLCDVAGVSYRAQIMFASAHAHAITHEQCDMALDQRRICRWKFGVSPKTSSVYAMHSNQGWFVPGDFCVATSATSLSLDIIPMWSSMLVSGTTFIYS